MKKTGNIEADFAPSIVGSVLTKETVAHILEARFWEMGFDEIERVERTKQAKADPRYLAMAPKLNVAYFHPASSISVAKLCDRCGRLIEEVHFDADRLAEFTVAGEELFQPFFFHTLQAEFYDIQFLRTFPKVWSELDLRMLRAYSATRSLILPYTMLDRLPGPKPEGT